MFYQNNSPQQLLPPPGQFPDAQPNSPYPARNGQPGYTYIPQSSYPPPVTNRPPVSPVGGPRRPKRSGARGAAIFALSFLLLVVLGVGLFAGWTFARAGLGSSAVANPAAPSSSIIAPASPQNQQEAAIAKVRPAVVQVEGQTARGTALGSGIIIDKNGDIITNNHVVAGASNLQVTLSNGSVVPVRVIGTDPANDLAVLRLQPYAGMVVATLGDSSKLTVGQEVLAIGNPLGYDGTVTSGMVSALNRSARESNQVKLTGLIQVSAPINPGNSGGALIDLQGQVIGIPTLSAIDPETNTPAEGLGFAIPSNQVKAVLARVLG